MGTACRPREGSFNLSPVREGVSIWAARGGRTMAAANGVFDHNLSYVERNGSVEGEIADVVSYS